MFGSSLDPQLQEMFMFVSSKTYLASQNQCEALLKEIELLKADNQAISIENEQLHAQLNQQSSDEEQQFNASLLHSTIECINQIEGIRQTVLASYTTIDEESKVSYQISELLETSSKSLQQIIQEMDQMTSKMGSMTQSISGLSTMADSINNFVITISKISDQTNLLALNAAIEAARAGEAGRGFSVVADEVRTLATNTNKSAQEVSELVKGIISKTSETVNSVSTIQDNNSQLSSNFEALNNDYGTIIDHCSSMKNTITNAAIRSFIQTVKLDHIVWKGEVYAVANGTSNKSIDDFSNHTMCRLGQWYNSEEAQNFKQLSAFKQLEEPHKEVHRNGVEALVLIHSGEKTNAIKHINLMEAASERVMNLLDDIANH